MQSFPSSRVWLAAAGALLVSLCIAIPNRVSAATLSVTVNSTNQMVAPFIPAARSPTQVINSGAWRESETVLGIPTWIQGFDQLPADAVVDLNWLTGRIKTTTLTQNTTFTFSNTPLSSTNVAQMVIEVVGDAVDSVTFTGVSWQTTQVSVPAAFVVTRYLIESIGGTLTGYVLAGGSGGGGGGAVQVFSGYYGGNLPTDVPTTTTALAYDLDGAHTLFIWDGTAWW